MVVWPSSPHEPLSLFQEEDVKKLVTLFALVVAASPAAWASSYDFSFSGGGLSGSGIISVSSTPVPGVPGGYQVTGIQGVFSDATLGILNATIIGVDATSLPSNINSDGTFVPPAVAADGTGFSYDNIFYPGGNSPAVCPPPGVGDPEPDYPFGGGLLDIYGLLFNVQGGYSVDVWSNGVIPGFGLAYGVGDSKNGVVLDTFGEPFSGTSVNFSEAPEPSSLLLLGSGIAGLGLAFARKRKLSVLRGF
jgi:hypothetical protein